MQYSGSMSEHASQEITIIATAPQVLEAVLELDEYPLWIPEIESITVFERDSRGRALRAELISNAMGKTITHIYKYSYDNYPEKITWTLESGNMVSALEGSYSVKESKPETTTVTYDLDVTMSSPLPGFMKRKAAQKIVSSALDSLKKRCEDPRH